MFDLPPKLIYFLCHEGVVTLENVVRDAADCPHIDLAVHLDPRQLVLWCHIMLRSANDLHQSPVFDRRGKTKVGHFDARLRGSLRILVLKQDVIGFQIPVHDALVMHIVDGEAQLANDVFGLLF